MGHLQSGQHIQKRCTNCFHDKMEIIKVSERDFNEKVVYMLWIQCPECGTNDSELVPENLSFS
ncbi:hypothetical protein [Halobacillus mangrovi]|uniref:hypothetical protein n=1 Tax=Halobacillus mangrovi TaxID=402384 RepID=UPI003D95A88C